MCYLYPSLSLESIECNLRKYNHAMYIIEEDTADVAMWHAYAAVAAISHWQENMAN